MKQAFLCIFLLLLPRLTPSLAAERIQTRTLRQRATIRAIAFAEKAEIIRNTLRWPQIKTIIPDGAYVNKGDLLVEFDSEYVKFQLRDLHMQRAIIDAQMKRDLTGIRNRENALHDNLSEQEDKINVMRAKLARLKELPDKDEVKIAEGRRRIASLEYAAATNTVAKALRRFERGMISPTERDACRQKADEREAILKNACRHLAIMSLPAGREAVRKLELQIENVQMEIEKLKHEISENSQISKIQRESEIAQKEIIEKRVREKEEDVEHTRIVAPLSGYVMYLPHFKNRTLKSGEKLWKGMNFLKIPDQRTLAFRGALIDSNRRFFNPGDRVDIHVVGHPRQKLEGQIFSISKFSHDMAEREEEQGWLGNRAGSGIMVYDVVIKEDNPTDWLRIGMHAECALQASRAMTGPTVPLSVVRKREDEYYISLNGVYTPVSGVAVEGYLMLDDVSLEGREADFYGRFEAEPESTPASQGKTFFRAHSKIIPVDTEDIIVDRIYGRQKIIWLIPEDEEVKKDDVVARLDPKETDEDILRWESNLKEAEGKRETIQEQANLKKQEETFRLKRERNLLEITRIDLDETQNGRDETAIANTELTLRKLTIKLNNLNKRIARIEGRNLISPLELQRLKRDRERTKLQKEAAEIRLAILKRGTEPIQRRKAQLAFLTQKLKVQNLVKEIETENFNLSQKLRRAERRVKHVRERLDNRREWRAHLEIKAPRGGLLQYAKVWNSGVFSKISVGSVVGHRSVLMKVADVSAMYLRLEIPERYFTIIHEGLPTRIEVPSCADASLAGRISKIEFLFESKRKKDAQVGLYSSHEALGETVFHVHAQIVDQKEIKLKPGAMANVSFPFTVRGEE